MKSWLLLVASALVSTGCTSLALERHSVSQAVSAEELRYREVLDNLAMVAYDPASLPTYCSIFSGQAQITDSGQISSMTVWQHVTGKNGFGGETLTPQLSRMALQNWVLDPVVVPEKLEAMRYACQWVVYGREFATRNDFRVLLASPAQAPTPGRHFGVADALARLPDGWLHIGKLSDVPAHACYKAHFKSEWVWVQPEGVQALSDFAVIFQNIARVASNSPTLFAIPPPTGGCTLAAESCPSACPCACPSCQTCTASVDMVLDPCQRLVSPAGPYVPLRIDTVGADSKLISKINAAGASH
jgi:hypothetical protein